MFLTVLLHRLMRGGSDLAADRWREDYRITGTDDLSICTTSIVRWPGWAKNYQPSNKLAREVVLSDATPFVPLVIEKRGRDTDYGAKAVTLGGARYIVCINHREAAKDAAERSALLAAMVMLSAV